MRGAKDGHRSPPVKTKPGRRLGGYAWWLGFASGVVAALLLLYLLVRLEPSWLPLP